MKLLLVNTSPFILRSSTMLDAKRIKPVFDLHGKNINKLLPNTLGEFWCSH